MHKFDALVAELPDIYRAKGTGTDEDERIKRWKEGWEEGVGRPSLTNHTARGTMSTL